jgi:hypothetical protein
MEKITEPALPPAPTMPATEPDTFGLRYGTRPNVDPSALWTNRLKVIKAAIAPGRVLAFEKTYASNIYVSVEGRKVQKEVDERFMLTIIKIPVQAECDEGEADTCFRKKEKKTREVFK